MTHPIDFAVIKYGGNALAGAADEAVVEQFAFDVVQLHHNGLHPIVVHGGGPQISELMRQRDKQPEFRSGLRVTDAETIEIVRTALMDIVNPQLVAAINAHVPLATGVSGEDLIVASCSDPALGLVGDVAAVDEIVLLELAAKGLIPVVAPLGKDAAGQTYNINADVVAGAIAVAVRARHLVYLTDIDGLRREVTDASSLISEATADELDQLLAEGVIVDGMVPKVRSCVEAVRGGVAQARLLDGRVAHALQVLLTGEPVGTVVR